MRLHALRKHFAGKGKLSVTTPRRRSVLARAARQTRTKHPLPTAQLNALHNQSAPLVSTCCLIRMRKNVSANSAPQRHIRTHRFTALMNVLNSRCATTGIFLLIQTQPNASARHVQSLLFKLMIHTDGQNVLLHQFQLAQRLADLTKQRGRAIVMAQRQALVQAASLRTQTRVTMSAQLSQTAHACAMAQRLAWGQHAAKSATP